MINYNLIKEKFPKAFEAFMSWRKKKVSGMVWPSISDRDLFDFFDEVGIFILPDLIYKDEDENELAFVYNVFNYYKNERHLISYVYSTRPEAETAGFLEAFKILENDILEEWGKVNKNPE